MNKRRFGMLAVLVVLFGLAAWMTMSGDPEKPAGPAVEFPREMTPEARRRVASRRTHPVQLPGANGAERQVVQQDPLLASLPRGAGKTAVVLEANAIRHSPLGEMFLACTNAARAAEKIKEQSGIDVLQDLDRVAVTGNGLTISGDFAAADWDTLLPAEAERISHGDGGRIFKLQQPGQNDREEAFAVWGDSFIMIGKEDELRRTIDRLEGRGEDEPPALDESQTYGEVYGMVGNEDLIRFVGEEAELSSLSGLLGGANVELHADTSGDVGMVARFANGDPSTLRDLGKAMAGMLSAARIEAMASGDDEKIRLLDMASINPGSGEFNLEVALPQSYLSELAAKCTERREEARERAQMESDSQAPETTTFEPAPDEHRPD